MTYEIEIMAMNRITEPKPNKSGDYIVANFDAVVGPLELRHCALVKIYKRERYRGLAAWPPRIDTPHGLRGITIHDRELSAELRDAARVVFNALGGDEREA